MGSVSVISLYRNGSGFDVKQIKNIYLRNNPRLSRIGVYNHVEMTSLEYIEMSGMGQQFANQIDKELTTLFSRVHSEVSCDKILFSSF